MPRKGPIPKREILPDPKYGNLKLSKFINNLMERGKKSTAEKIIYSALEEISNKAKRDPLEIFEEALDQVGPHVEVKSRRVGGATYQVPLEVKAGRKMAIAMRWLVTSAKKRSEKKMSTKLANELMAYSYSHLFKLPTTGLRFFTVYGPWGRPDMALFLFIDARID